MIDYGRSIRPGQSSSPPNAEIALGPVEGTAQGVLVIDGSIPHPSLNMIREPITMHVEDGQIVMISGTNEADTVRRILEQYKDSRVYNIGEVGLPVNRENKICGRMLADEGAYGDRTYRNWKQPVIWRQCGGSTAYGYGYQGYHIENMGESYTQKRG
mgnify:CR=1 FL=1